MKYRVLLVDDEPLVLAGIKMMIDWEASGCELVGDARNGRYALDSIHQLRPHIVIADINMPVMNGIELIKEAEEKYPEIVFIMLTNLQEFDLAREALRYRAVDYLIKTQLETGTLEASLFKAKEESDKRRKLSRADISDSFQAISREQLLRDSILSFISFPTIPSSSLEILQAEDILDSYAVAEIQFRIPGRLWENYQSEEAEDQLYRWEQEVTKELARNCFTNAVTIDLGNPQQGILLMVWGLDKDAYLEGFASFQKKLVNASSKITGVFPCLMVSDLLEGAESLPQCKNQLFTLRDAFYLSSEDYILYERLPGLLDEKVPGHEYIPLTLSGIASQLKTELLAKNATSCKALLEKAAARVRDIPHEKSQGTWLCIELYSTITEVLGQLGHEAHECGSFLELAALHLKYISTREDVLRYLTLIQNEVSAILQPLSTRSSDLLEKARQYVYENIYDKITLQDAARHVSISPGYLSSSFKKHYGENFVDFINRTKIEQACKLIQEGGSLIGQIGYMLSYENAYYFTRVFKKHMGMTPSEYQEQIRKNS